MDDLGAEVGRGNAWRIRNRCFRLRNGRCRRPEAAAAECRLPPPELILATFLVGGAFFALFPFAVLLDLVAGEKAAQVALESILSIFEILAHVLESLGVEQGGRAVTTVQALVHLVRRDGGAVALWSCGNHERIVGLCIVRGLLITQSEQHSRRCRIQGTGQLDARKSWGTRSVPTLTHPTATKSALCQRQAGRKNQRYGQEHESNRANHIFSPELSLNDAPGGSIVAPARGVALFP